MGLAGTGDAEVNIEYRGVLRAKERKLEERYIAQSNKDQR